MTKKVKITDLTEEKELKREELDKVKGGLMSPIIGKETGYCTCSCGYNTTSALNKNTTSGA